MRLEVQPNLLKSAAIFALISAARIPPYSPNLKCKIYGALRSRNYAQGRFLAQREHSLSVWISVFKSGDQSGKRRSYGFAKSV